MPNPYFQLGQQAFLAGTNINANPYAYPQEAGKHKSWEDGWLIEQAEFRDTNINEQKPYREGYTAAIDNLLAPSKKRHPKDKLPASGFTMAMKLCPYPKDSSESILWLNGFWAFYAMRELPNQSLHPDTITN
jgi:ribosome modulation factor